MLLSAIIRFSEALVGYFYEIWKETFDTLTGIFNTKKTKEVNEMWNSLWTLNLNGELASESVVLRKRTESYVIRLLSDTGRVGGEMNTKFFIMRYQLSFHH